MEGLILELQSGEMEVATEIHMGQRGDQLPALCSGSKGKGAHGLLALEVFGFV